MLDSHGVICGGGGVRGGGGTGTTGRGAFFFFECRHFFFLAGVSANVVSMFSMELAAAPTARGEIASTRESVDCAAAAAAEKTAASLIINTNLNNEAGPWLYALCHSVPWTATVEARKRLGIHSRVYWDVD